VREVTEIGQLEFGWDFIFLFFPFDMNRPPARWKCENPALFAGFASAVGRVENSAF
jgi:hypothetical protein